MALRYLSKTLPLGAVMLDPGVVELQRVVADVAAFKAGAPHAGAHSLDDQVAFEFGDGADDDYDGPAQRAAGIDIFPEADVLDLQPVQLVQDLKKVLHRPGYASLADSHRWRIKIRTLAPVPSASLAPKLRHLSPFRRLPCRPPSPGPPHYPGVLRA